MRRWASAYRPWVVAVSVFLFCAVASLLAPAPKPVYAMDGQLVFTPSNAVGYGNSFRADSSNMIFFAAAVERAYNVTPTTSRVASSDATLYGIGVRDGSRVTLPNSGGQWQTNFNQPYLRVEVVSGTENETRARFAEIVARIRAIAEQRQLEVGVDVPSQVKLNLSPSQPQIQYVSGSHTRATAAGLLLSTLAAAGVYAVTSRRQLPRSRRLQLGTVIPGTLAR